MVVSLSLVDLEEEKERESWGRRVVAIIELLSCEKPVEARSLFFLGYISAME